MADEDPSTLLIRFVNQMLAAGASKPDIAAALRKVADYLEQEAASEPEAADSNKGLKAARAE